MFWSKARKVYNDVAIDDIDIVKYSNIVDQVMIDGYKGLTGYIQDLGHKFVSDYTQQGRTLEIGFGKGRQSRFYKGEKSNYYPTEIDMTVIDENIWKSYENACLADARKLPFENEFFDNIVSIYNLEHICELELVIQEFNRVIKKNGKIIVALPCEDGLLYNIGREISTRRVYTKKYQINYDKIIATQHVHNLKFIKDLFDNEFINIKQRFYPLRIPSINLNLIYCAVYRKNNSY